MPRLIAMDLGSHAVKVSTYRISGRQVDYEGRFQQPVPQDGATPSLEAKLAALETLLEEEEEAQPAPGDTVVVAYPSSQASFHRLTVPFSDKAQIGSTLPFMLEDEVPFDLADMVVGWRTAGQGNGTDVVAVIARRDQLSSWLSELTEHGVDPAAVHVDADVYGPWGVLASPGPDVGNLPPPDESDPTDIDANVDGEDGPRSPLVAVVDVGHDHTSVTVVQDGVAHLCRSINVGGRAFTRAVQQVVGCTWEQAEALKHGGEIVLAPPEPAEDPDAESTQPFTAPSGPMGLPPKAREAMERAMLLLLTELRSTLIKAEDTLGAEVLEVRVTGGSSQLALLREKMADDLGVPVVEARDPSGDGASGPFSLSAALAWSSVPGVQAAVDLRVGELQYRGGTNLVRAVLTYGVAGAAFFTLAATLMFGWQYWSLSTEQSTAEAAVFDTVREAMGPEAASVELETLSAAKALMAGATEDAAQLAAVVGREGDVPRTVDTLYNLTKAFPPHPDVRVELSELKITRETITFEAETDNFNSSAQVENQLRTDPRFADATKGQEKKLSNGRVRFPITIPIGNTADGEEG